MRHKDFPSSSVVKNLPAMQELQKTWVQSLCQEDPLYLQPSQVNT